MNLLQIPNPILNELTPLLQLTTHEHQFTVVHLQTNKVSTLVRNPTVVVRTELYLTLLHR